MRVIRSHWAILATLGSFSLASTAFAQTADDEGTHQEEAVDPAAVETPEDETIVDFQWSGGVNLATGNSRSFAATTSLSFNLKEGPHVLDYQTLLNLGYAVSQDEAPRASLGDTFNEDNRNALNIIGRLRYDNFITEDDAVFAAIWGRHDPFAGLDFRLQAQVGYLRNFYRQEKVRIWGEVGYDATIDWQRPESVDDANPVDQHSGRLFLGYDNQINEVLTYRSGIEYLLEFADPENSRIFWTNALGSKVNEVLTLALNFTLIFDNQPVGAGTPQVRDKVDTITAFTFVVDII